LPQSSRRRLKAVAVVVGLGSLAACAAPPESKLIEFGWDEPDPAFMRANAAAMDATPFDGCVFHVHPLTWGAFGTKPVGDDALAESAVRDLRAAPLRRLRENFLRVNATPGDVDWFDDMGAVRTNMRLAARIARAGGARGLLFDVEQYQGRLFDYNRQRDRKTRSWSDYAAQARRRGRDVMDALQDGYPDLVVFLTFGHSLPFVLSRKGEVPLAETEYGLLAPFLDGLLDQARGRTRIVDGFELSYGYEHAPHFDEARRLVREETLAIVGNRPAYHRRVELAFGLWMDYDWRRRGWSATDTARNHFTPEEWQGAVERARLVSDGYVWIYGEQVRWWGADAARLPVPDAYMRVLDLRPPQ